MTTLARYLERLAEDPKALKAFRSDPEKAATRARLSPKDKKALVSGDPARIREALGAKASPDLLMVIRFWPVTPLVRYLERLAEDPKERKACLEDPEKAAAAAGLKGNARKAFLEALRNKDDKPLLRAISEELGIEKFDARGWDIRVGIFRLLEVEFQSRSRRQERLK